MADYLRTIGSGDEMMIRDTGSNVEFWFHTSAGTWNYQQNWAYGANGGWYEGEFRLENNGAWHHVGTASVTSRQNVTFRMYDEGLGWPTTDFTVFIERSTAPPAPTITSVTAVSPNAVDVVFRSNGDGGSPITRWVIGYSTSSANPTTEVDSDGSTRISGLSSGTTYYFWARGVNARGLGNWSGRVSEFTWRIPDAPKPVTFSNTTQTSTRAKFVGGFDGGEPVDEWQLAYGTNPDIAFATILTSNGTNDLTGLAPGQLYYAWARGRNAVGWSPWSSVRTETLRAGAMVKQDGVWKRALPYVRVGGVWRLARPRAKIAGVWKETA